MGQLLSFPNRLRHGVMEAETPAPEAAEAKLDTMAKKLGMALDLLDRMAAKLEQMNRLLPTNLKLRFEKQQLEVLDQINQAHLKVAPLADFSKD
jgi:hypothetical protein